MRASRSPRAFNARTSSISPASSIASKRSRCGVQHAAIGRLERQQRPAVGASRGRARAGSTAACPQLRHTSSAREMRCASSGASRAAVAGSTRASCAMHRGPAVVRAASRSIAARTAGSPAGIASSPSRSALKYSIVPPTSSGTRPRARIAAIAASRIGDEARGRVGCRPDRSGRSGDAAPRPAPRPSASRCRCPCRDRPAPSRR